MKQATIEALTTAFRAVMVEATEAHEQFGEMTEYEPARCERHKGIHQQNYNAAGGVECGMCVHDAAESDHQPNPETHNTEDVNIFSQLCSLLVAAGIDTANGLLEAVRELINQRNCERGDFASVCENNKALNADLGNLKKECERLRKQHKGGPRGRLLEPGTIIVASKPSPVDYSWPKLMVGDFYQIASEKDGGSPCSVRIQLPGGGHGWYPADCFKLVSADECSTSQLTPPEPMRPISKPVCGTILINKGGIRVHCVRESWHTGHCEGF
jgi:hypothetical protein